MFRVEEYAPALLNRQVDSFIDLGCSAGWFALWLTARGRSRTSPGLLIDANPRMVAEAIWHVKRNSLVGCAVVHGAVGLPPGESLTRFHIQPSSAASSVVPYQEARQYPAKGRIVDVDVPTVSVAKEWQRQFANTIVDLMKIDIEGKELDFIEYEGAFIQRSVKSLIVEWHKWCVTLDQLDARLESIGFKRQGVYGETAMVGVALYENVH
jgi:FkbM family methyltransferase